MKIRHYDAILNRFVHSDEFDIQDSFERLEAFFRKAKVYAHKGIVQEFTGYFDKNKNPIFKGDILHFKMPKDNSSILYPNYAKVSLGEIAELIPCFGPYFGKFGETKTETLSLKCFTNFDLVAKFETTIVGVSPEITA